MNENLARKIESSLPTDALDLIKKAAGLAAARSERLYLVGGVVRDLLLGRQTLDIDLAVEGDAAGLARALAGDEADNITLHPQFNTARLDWRGLTIDLASARRETYPHPGALPVVSPVSIEEDLFRRDFTINAMAVSLNPDDFGRLIDPYNGQGDLRGALIRIIHAKSFLDDPTRIWRGLRYERRLGFRLEPETLRLLKRHITLLDSVSGDRIYYELECALREEAPERILHRAGEMGVLQKLDPALASESRLDERFRHARALVHPDSPSTGLYLALLAYDLGRQEKKRLISYLNLKRSLARTLLDADDIGSRLPQLSQPDMKPSAVYHLLDGFSKTAISSVMIAADSPAAKANIELYLNVLRSEKPVLTGDDLIAMGIPEGPRIKEILERLLDGRLDGKVRTREDEEKLVLDCSKEQSGF